MKTKIERIIWTKTLKTPCWERYACQRINAICCNPACVQAPSQPSNKYRYPFQGLFLIKEKPRKQFTAYCLLVLVTLFLSAKRGVLLLGCFSLQGGFRFVRQRRQVYLDSMTHGLKTNGRKTINNREGFYGFWLIKSVRSVGSVWDNK